MDKMERFRTRRVQSEASGRDTKSCASPDGLRWVDAGCILPTDCSSVLLILTS